MRATHRFRACNGGAQARCADSRLSVTLTPMNRTTLTLALASAVALTLSLDAQTRRPAAARPSPAKPTAAATPKTERPVPFRAGEVLRYLGENSIVVYLAFFLFMATTRTLALKFAPGLGPDVISIATTLAGVIGPVVLFWLTRNSALSFLFRRPAWARLKPPQKLETPAKVWHSAGHDQQFEVSSVRSQGR